MPANVPSAIVDLFIWSLADFRPSFACVQMRICSRVRSCGAISNQTSATHKDFKRARICFVVVFFGLCARPTRRNLLNYKQTTLTQNTASSEQTPRKRRVTSPLIRTRNANRLGICVTDDLSHRTNTFPFGPIVYLFIFAQLNSLAIHKKWMNIKSFLFSLICGLGSIWFVFFVCWLTW